jgi:hypothetical protein
MVFPFKSMNMYTIHLSLIDSSFFREFGDVITYAVFNLALLLGLLLAKIIFFLGLCFARVIGAFFYTLLVLLFDFPCWAWACFSDGPAETGPINLESVQKRIDMPEGWIRVSICGTDEISEFDLDWIADTEDSNVGWEGRKVIGATKEEIDRKVLRWLIQIYVDEGYESAESVDGRKKDKKCSKSHCLN